MNTAQTTPNRQELFAAALEYRKVGLRCIPTKSDKTPACKKWTGYRESQTEEDLRALFFDDSQAVAGLAILTGIDGLEAIDVDSKYWLGDSDLMTDYMVHNDSKNANACPIAELALQSTISEGYHILYRCRKIAGNTKLAKRPTTEGERKDAPKEKYKVLLETRGTGGYIVAYPTPGYSIIMGEVTGKGFWAKIPTITEEQRQGLFAAAKDFDEVAQKVQTAQPAGERATGLTPWQDFDQRGGILSHFAAAGWHIVKEQGQRTYLKRPGSSSSTTSANWHNGKRVFFCFSTSTEFEAEKGYSASACFALLNHNGDFAASAKALRALGYGDAQPVQPVQPKQATAKPVQPAKQREPLPTWPMDVMPPILQEYIRVSSVAKGINEDHLAASVLVAISGAVGNSRHLEVKQGTSFAGNIFLAIVGAANVNKTAAVTNALKPLSKKQAANMREYKAKMIEWEAQKQESQTKRGKQKPKAQDPSKAQEVPAAKEVPKKPVWEQYVCEDVTLEAMATMLEKNPRGMIMDRDELAGWLRNFNRYSGGGEEQTWMSLWACKQLLVNRKTSDDLLVENPFVSIVGTIQKGVLGELADGDRRKNGFFDRWLFCYPEHAEKALWTEDIMPAHLEQQYAAGIEALQRLKIEGGKPGMVVCPADVRALLFKYWNTSIKPEADSIQGADKSLLGRFDVQGAKLALLLQMMWYGFGNGSADEMQMDIATKAIRLNDYFRAMARFASGVTQDHDPTEELPTDRAALYDGLPGKFTTAEGCALAEGAGLPKRTFQYWLKTTPELFEKVSYGVWAKTC